VSTASIRTARKFRRCETHETYTGCRGYIKPGERYRRAVAFPSDGFGNEAPWVLNECQPCAEYYSRWDAIDLHEQHYQEIDRARRARCGVTT